MQLVAWSAFLESHLVGKPTKSQFPRGARAATPSHPHLPSMMVLRKLGDYTLTSTAAFIPPPNQNRLPGRHVPDFLVPPTTFHNFLYKRHDNSRWSCTPWQPASRDSRSQQSTNHSIPCPSVLLNSQHKSPHSRCCSLAHFTLFICRVDISLTPSPHAMRCIASA